MKNWRNKGTKRYKVVFPKGQKKWVTKPVTDKKSYSFVQNLMKEVGNYGTVYQTEYMVYAVFRVFHTLVSLHDFKVPMFKRVYNLWKLFCFGAFSLQLGIIFTAVSDQIQNREYRIVYTILYIHT